MKTSDEMRREFEKWCIPVEPVSRSEDDYRDRATQAAWLAWQECHRRQAERRCETCRWWSESHRSGNARLCERLTYTGLNSVSGFGTPLAILFKQADWGCADWEPREKRERE